MSYKKSFFKVFKSLLCILLLLVLVPILLCFYPVFIEPNLLIVKHQEVYVPNWHTSHDGLKIAVLSDFHLNKWGINLQKLAKVVEKTNKEKPDVIFLLGDLDSYLIAREKFDKKQIAKILSGLSSKNGVFSVLGNHDYGPRVVKPILKKAGIVVLENHRFELNVNGETLVIYGLKDFWHYSPDVNKIIKQYDRGRSIVLLSHNPDIFPQVPSFISLTLSGHTHGGQVCVPFLGGLFTPSMWEQRFNKGYIVENNKHLFVTSGLGFSIPLRFGNPPEIVILKVYSQKNHPNKKIENTQPLTGIKRSLNSFGMSIATKILGYFKES